MNTNKSTNKITILGVIKQIFGTKTTEKGMYRKCWLAFQPRDKHGNPTGDEIIYELVGFGERCEKLEQFMANDIVEVEVWLNSKRSQTATFDGYNLQMVLQNIRTAE